MKRDHRVSDFLSSSRWKRPGGASNETVAQLAKDQFGWEWRKEKVQRWEFEIEREMQVHEMGKPKTLTDWLSDCGVGKRLYAIITLAQLLLCIEARAKRIEKMRICHVNFLYLFIYLYLLSSSKLILLSSLILYKKRSLSLRSSSHRNHLNI